MRTKIIILAIVFLLAVSYFFVLRPYQASSALQDGIALYEAEQYDAALQALNRSLSLKKEDAEALSYKSLTLYAMSRYLEAIETASLLVELEHDNKKGWRVLGLSYWHTDDLQHAESSLSRYIALDSLAYDMITARGEVRFAMGDTTKAAEDFRKTLAINEKQGSPNYYLAKFAFSQALYDSVLALSNQALKFQYDSLVVYRLQADAFDSLQRQADLLEVLYLMEQLGETTSEHYYRIGYNAYRLGRHEASITALSQALAQGLSDENAYYYRGTSYVSKQEFDKAIKDYNQVIDKHSGSEKELRALYNRALAYMHSGSLPLAKQDLTRLTRLTPQDDRVYISLGICHAREGDFEASIQSFERALAINEGADAYFYRGVSRGMLSSHQEAIRDYSTAIELKKNYKEAFFNRGVSYLNLNNFANACLDLREASRLGFKQADELIPTYCLATGN